MNIISEYEKSSKIKNYFCTWRTQATLKNSEKYLKIRKNSTPDVLSEEFLFGEPGILNDIPEKIRRDLIVVIDDGWDVPYGLKATFGTEDFKKYGSMILDEERFPSFTGTPAERLKKLGDKIKSMGYNGLGLWIAIQMPGEDYPGKDANGARGFWEERFGWCREADVKYLKIDWGNRTHDYVYRKMMNDVAKSVYPELLIEQAYNQQPFDMLYSEHGSDDYRIRLAKISTCLKNGDIFRVYDNSQEFKTTTMFSRAIEAFKSVHGNIEAYIAIPNVEDEVYIGAALGCCVGAMRDYVRESDPDNKLSSDIETSENELVRAVMWYRIAPPFAVKDSDFEISDEIFTDIYKYPHIDGNPWPYKSDKLVAQNCYAAMSRNMPLPIVGKSECGEKPYVMCAKNPITSAISVFAAPRVIGGSCNITPLSKVRIHAETSEIPIGIFGHFDSLEIEFEDFITGKHVYAQDLAADEAMDITDEVDVKEALLTIKGETIDRIGLSVKQTENELPGLVIILK